MKFASDSLELFYAIMRIVPDTYLEDYDRIVTGDLGFEGGSILCDLLRADGYPIALLMSGLLIVQSALGLYVALLFNQ